MDPMIQIFFIVWFYVLPILAITLIALIPIAWFFIVPKVARMLTWCRFRNISIHAIADDSGYVELVSSNVELPEGVVRTKRGWRFLPSPIFKPSKRTSKKKEEFELQKIEVERLALRKYVLKGLGKPFYLGYAGMVPAVNPVILAALQPSTNPIKPGVQKYIPIDPRAIKEVLPEMTPPSLVDAIETYSEMVGMEEKGKQYTGLILGGVLIIGMVIALIVVASFLLA